MASNFIILSDEVIRMCAVCVSDRSGAQIALLVIVSGLILLGLGNWAFKKYISNKKKILKQ